MVSFIVFQALIHALLKPSFVFHNQTIIPIKATITPIIANTGHEIAPIATPNA